MSEKMEQAPGLLLSLVCWFVFLMLLFNEAATFYVLLFLCFALLVKLFDKLTASPARGLIFGVVLGLVLPFGDEDCE